MKEHESPWKMTTLFADGRTEAAQQIAGRDMKVVEDLDDEALPTCYDDSTSSTIQGAKKFEQIGPDASYKLIHNATENLSFPDRSVLILADNSPGVGNNFEAFLKLKGTLQLPVFHFGVLEVMCTWSGSSMFRNRPWWRNLQPVT